MEPDQDVIYHLTPADYFNSLPADQPYRPREFDRDGFIHCTKGEERMLLVADTIHRRTPGDFLLLVIDERKVAASIRYENAGGILFPHIYGPLNRDAIVRVVALGRRDDGSFLPIGEPDPPAERATMTEAWLSQARVEQMLAESADLRAKTVERLVRIEGEISTLKSQIARQVFPPSATITPVVSAQPAAPAPSAPAPGATASMETLEARVERVERSLHQLAARLESLEQHNQTSNLKSQKSKSAVAKTRRPGARRSSTRRK